MTYELKDITPGWWELNDGRKVRVFCNDAPDEHPIRGYEEDGTPWLSETERANHPLVGFRRPIPDPTAIPVLRTIPMLYPTNSGSSERVCMVELPPAGWVVDHEGKAHRWEPKP